MSHPADPPARIPAVEQENFVRIAFLNAVTERQQKTCLHDYRMSDARCIHCIINEATAQAEEIARLQSDLAGLTAAYAVISQHASDAYVKQDEAKTSEDLMQKCSGPFSDARDCPVHAPKPAPDTAEWWREVAQGLSVTIHTMKQQREQDRRAAFEAGEGMSRGANGWVFDAHVFSAEARSAAYAAYLAAEARSREQTED